MCLPSVAMLVIQSISWLASVFNVESLTHLYIILICILTSSLSLSLSLSLYIYICTHTHTHTHTYIYIYIYVCVCVCVSAFVPFNIYFSPGANFLFVKWLFKKNKDFLNDSLHRIFYHKFFWIIHLNVSKWSVKNIAKRQIKNSFKNKQFEKEKKK